MSRSAARARAGQDRTSLYSEITDKIIGELEAGRVPWVQPWGTAAAKAPIAMPKNAATQRRYSGVNVLILWGTVIERGFAGQSWLTFRQALTLGGNVRKGELGTTVVYADRFIPDDERKRAERDGDEPGAIPFLKRFTVFNTDQCDNLPDGLVTAPPVVPEGLILPQAEALIAATGADFRIGGNCAFYSPAHDYVQVPRPDAYFEPINWHRTALHERCSGRSPPTSRPRSASYPPSRAASTRSAPSPRASVRPAARVCSAPMTISNPSMDGQRCASSMSYSTAASACPGLDPGSRAARFRRSRTRPASD